VASAYAVRHTIQSQHMGTGHLILRIVEGLHIIAQALLTTVLDLYNCFWALHDSHDLHLQLRNITMHSHVLH